MSGFDDRCRFAADVKSVFNRVVATQTHDAGIHGAGLGAPSSNPTLDRGRGGRLRRPNCPADAREALRPGVYQAQIWSYTVPGKLVYGLTY